MRRFLLVNLPIDPTQRVTALRTEMNDPFLVVPPRLLLPKHPWVKRPMLILLCECKSMWTNPWRVRNTVDTPTPPIARVQPMKFLSLFRRNRKWCTLPLSSDTQVIALLRTTLTPWPTVQLNSWVWFLAQVPQMPPRTLGTSTFALISMVMVWNSLGARNEQVKPFALATTFIQSVLVTWCAMVRVLNSVLMTEQIRK